MTCAVEERRASASVPLWTHPGWADRFPWLVQGTTGGGESDSPFDLGLSGEQPVGAVLARWREVRRETGMEAAVHARQVHGAEIAAHRSGLAPGLLVMEGVDGHLTDRDSLLLSVSVADCVPVFLADERCRVIGLLHAGWRGTAAGILERAIERLGRDFGSRPESLWVHCGPAICGECYEVGPEVHAAVRPARQPPSRPHPIDLRRALLERVLAVGVPTGHVSLSGHCTRCGPGSFFSHRGGSVGRQMGLLGIRSRASSG